MPEMSDANRLGLLLKLFISKLDLDKDLVKASHRPGILSEFAKVHSWIWRPVFSRPGKFTNHAHTPMSRFHLKWLVEELLRREAKRKSAHSEETRRRDVQRLVAEEYVGRVRNVWFVPKRDAFLRRDEAVKLIIDYFSKHRSRALAGPRKKKTKTSLAASKQKAPHDSRHERTRPKWVAIVTCQAYIPPQVELADGDSLPPSST